MYLELVFNPAKMGLNRVMAPEALVAAVLIKLETQLWHYGFLCCLALGGSVSMQSGIFMIVNSKASRLHSLCKTLRFR